MGTIYLVQLKTVKIKEFDMLRFFEASSCKAMIAVLAAAVLVFALGGCGDADGGPTSSGPGTVSYSGYAGNVKYTLKITDHTARYAAQVGDSYELTISSGAKKSTGTVSGIGVTFTLQPSASGASAFTVTVAGTGISAMSGTITWDGGGTDPAPAALTPNSENGGNENGDIPANYQGTYDNDYHIWDNGQDWPLTTAIVTSNSIKWTWSDHNGVHEGEFINVTAGNGGNFAPGGYSLAGGSWAYLYSDGVKIGFILRYTINGEKAFYTGKKYVSDFFAPELGNGSLLGFNPAVVYSDIGDSVSNVQARYVPDDGEDDEPDPNLEDRDERLINAAGEAWINDLMDLGFAFTGFVFYENGDLREISGLIDGGNYPLDRNDLITNPWRTSEGVIYCEASQINGAPYIVEGNTLTLNPGTIGSTVYIKTNIPGLGGSGNNSSIFETGPGEVWVNDFTQASAYLFKEGKVYIVNENGVNNWTAPFLMESLTYTGNTLTNSGGAGETYTLSVADDTLTWKNNLNGEISTYTKRTGQTIAEL